jgi:hypothetical protein
MLLTLTRNLDARMRAKGFPFRVVAGPERAPDRSAPRVVIEFDPGGDGFGPPMRGPKMVMTRIVRAIARVYAKATVEGASVSEHRRIAEQMLDMLLAALDFEIRARLRTKWSRLAGAFVAPPDIERSETWSGAVYELRFEFYRAVMPRTWAGEGPPTAELEGIRSTTVVTGPGAVGEETACGGT